MSLTAIIFNLTLLLQGGPCVSPPFPPCCSNTPPCGPPPPPGLPIDNFVVLLLCVGLIFGIWFYNKPKNKALIA